MRSITEAGLTLETEIILNYEVAIGNPPAILTAVLDYVAVVMRHVECPRGVVTLCVPTVFSIPPAPPANLNNVSCCDVS